MEKERISYMEDIASIVYTKEFMEEVKIIEAPDTGTIKLAADIAHAINIVYTGTEVCRPINRVVNFDGREKFSSGTNIIIKFGEDYWDLTNDAVYGGEYTEVGEIEGIIPSPNLTKCRKIANYILCVYREKTINEER